MRPRKGLIECRVTVRIPCAPLNEDIANLVLSNEKLLTQQELIAQIQIKKGNRRPLKELKLTFRSPKLH